MPGLERTCLGVTAAVDALRRGAGPPMDHRTFFIVPMTDILLFAFFTAFAYRARFRAEAHKRLILIATIVLTDAAVGRFSDAVLRHFPLGGMEILPGFLIVIALYDLLSLHRVSRTTLWAGGVFLVLLFGRFPLGASAGWHWFAELLGGKAQDRWTGGLAG